MVKLFAHRANLDGPASGENRPEAIVACLEQGIGVEIDCWGMEGSCWVGHGRPQYRVEPRLLIDPRVICHAKNVDVVPLLLQLPAVVFCLDHDPFALCSNGLIWTNYGGGVTAQSIMCSPELVGVGETITTFYSRVGTQCYGICTDYPLKYREIMS